jgi:dimethylhistidine N-methyltransferase
MSNSKSAALPQTARQTADEEADRSAFSADVIAGLTAHPKRLSPKYFYDHEGSRLFEDITRVAEYYPTRTELGILTTHAAEIAGLIPDGAALIEFGSGACSKVRILLDAAPHLSSYVPVDISGDFLKFEARALARDYPTLPIVSVTADFTKVFALPAQAQDRPRAGFFPGSTIGNFDPHDAASFLRNAADTLGKGAVMIVGVDLVKDPAVLHAAYNDAAGVTAKFNLNLLRRMNRELAGNFKLDTFEHHAFYNRQKSRIEMHLASTKRQKVRVAGASFDFRAGETIHTECSYKYSPETFRALARGASWTPRQMWTDKANLFAVHALVHE